MLIGQELRSGSESSRVGAVHAVRHCLRSSTEHTWISSQSWWRLTGYTGDRRSKCAWRGFDPVAFML